VHYAGLGLVRARGSYLGLPPLPPEGVGRRAASWKPAICLVKVVVLGFLLFEDVDLPEAGPS
jgi:hypothetical protein